MRVTENEVIVILHSEIYQNDLWNTLILQIEVIADLIFSVRHLFTFLTGTAHLESHWNVFQKMKKNIG